MTSRYDEIRDIPRWHHRRCEAADGLEVIALGGPKPEGGDAARSQSPWPETPGSRVDTTAERP